MVIALLAHVALTCLGGWLYTSDAFWGLEWVEALHEAFANALLTLAALHVAVVIFTIWRHGENLVAAMAHGRKRLPADDDFI
jgi:cytochrome b